MICIMSHPKLIVSDQMEDTISAQIVTLGVGVCVWYCCFVYFHLLFYFLFIFLFIFGEVVRVFFSFCQSSYRYMSSNDPVMCVCKE